LEKYAPETRKQKQERLRNTAASNAKNSTPKPVNVKYGLNHVTYLVEQKRAKLVLIASDVDPIETVVFLPTLCKAMGVPFAIVQCKARLGKLVHKKTASCVALTEFTHSQAELNNIARTCEQQFNSTNPTWRSKKHFYFFYLFLIIFLIFIYILEPEQGNKSKEKVRRQQKILEAEESKKM
jgi:large subunit ribosomal protein L7Ae